MFVSNFLSSSRMVSAAFLSCCTHTFYRPDKVFDCAIEEFHRCRHSCHGADTITAGTDLAIVRW